MTAPAPQRPNGSRQHTGYGIPEQQSFGPRLTPVPPIPHPSATLMGTGPLTVVPATVEEFMGRLQAMRAALGLSYSQIATRAGRGFGKSTANRVLKDVQTLIELKHLRLFLKACNVSPADRERWLRAWDLLNERTATTAQDTAAADKRTVQNSPASGSEADGERLTSGDNGTIDTTAPPAAWPRAAPNQATTESPSVSLEPAPEETGESEEPSPAPQSKITAVRSVLALGGLVVIITGSAVAMWVIGVPTEVIITAYGLVIVCVSAWLAVARMSINASLNPDNDRHAYRPSYLIASEHPWELFGIGDDEDNVVSPEVIGDQR